MNDATDTFTRLRPRLQGIAYRMLGSSARLSESPTTPEQLLERADDISIAFLAVLERLAPGGTLEVAGPEAVPLDELIRDVLQAEEGPAGGRDGRRRDLLRDPVGGRLADPRRQALDRRNLAGILAGA